MCQATAPPGRQSWYPVVPFLVIAACTLIVTPSAFTPEQLLCTAVDAPHFYYRLHEIEWLSDRGVLWPRWGPNLSYGYGYPVFHYYGSLAFYPSLILHKVGLSLLTSFQAGFWLALVCSGWATFLWLRRVTRDDRAAVLGAIVYIYIPYHLNATLYRWNLPEPWAMVFPPLALYGLHRLADTPDRRSVALTALSCAALVLTSNLATIVFVPLLATYALLLLVLNTGRKRLFGYLGSAAGLALALCAFFVIPAFVDRDAIQITRGVSTGGTNIYNHFLPLHRLLTQPLSADPSRTNPLYDPLSLGFAAFVAGGSALTVWFRSRSRTTRILVLWALLLTLGCVCLATRAGEPIYKIFPSLRILQFPWRFLAPASLTIALLVGLGFQSVMRAITVRHANTATAITVIGWIVLSSPLFYPGSTCAQAANPTVKQAVAAQVGMVGTISTNAEYLPTTVSTIPKTSPMYDSYMAERPVIRWDLATLPAGAQTLSIEDTGLTASWKVTSPNPFTAVYQAFAFPGWKAAIDGQLAQIHIVAPHGLIGVDLPSGTHTVTVRFGNTLDRTIASIISAGALFTSLVLMITQPRPNRSPPAYQLSWPSAIGLIAAGISLLLIRTQIVDRLPIWPRIPQFDGQTVAGTQNPTSIHFTGGERLLGYDLLTQPTSLGAPLGLDLYWATDSGQPFRALLRLVDQDGKPWTDWDTIVDFAGLIGPPGPGSWGPERYTSLRYRIDIPVGTPPGQYALTLTAIDPETHTPHYVENGPTLTAVRTEAIVGTVDVQPGRPSRVRKIAQTKAVSDLNRPVDLIDCVASKDRAQVGETVVLWPLWWIAPQATIVELEITLDDDSHHTQLTHHSLSQASQASQSARVVRDRVEVLLPAGLSAGHYSWTIHTNGARLPVGSLVVLVPDRQVAVPADVEPSGETLGGFAELVGYQVADMEPGHPLTVDLYWRAKQETQKSLKSFVQVLDTENKVLAQSDTIPAGWTRWTTGWLPPEVIQDTHRLLIPNDLPAGCCQVIVGLYDPATGQRALTASGQDVIVLDQPGYPP